MTAQSKSLVVYEIAKGKKIEVPIEKDSVWLTQAQMSELFSTNRTVITKHLKKITSTKEVSEEGNVQRMHFPGSDKLTKLYSLDYVISVGYRVNSRKATQFRIWATKTLRDHKTIVTPTTKKS